MNLNQLINEMSDKELALPFSIYVEVPRYISELEDFELSADSVEDFFDSYVTDDYLLRATAYIDYERVVVYLDINDLEVTQNGYDKEYGEYCVATRFQGELLNSYGELFSESVKSNKKLRLSEDIDSELPEIDSYEAGNLSEDDYNDLLYYIQELKRNCKIPRNCDCSFDGTKFIIRNLYCLSVIYPTKTREIIITLDYIKADKTTFINSILDELNTLRLDYITDLVRNIFDIVYRCDTETSFIDKIYKYI